MSSSSHPQGVPVPLQRMPDGVRLLGLTGDLDTITTVGQGEESAEDFAPHSTLLVVPNAAHGVALCAYSPCVDQIVRDFVRSVSDASSVEVTPNP